MLEGRDAGIRIPALTQRVDDARASDLLNTANSHRRGDNPMTRARKMQRHMSFGHSLKEEHRSHVQHDPHDGQEFP